MRAGGRFHEGELAVQERTGERPTAIRNGAIIRDTIAPGSALTFLGMQRTLAVAAVDRRGRPWATLWSGEPGFVHSEDGSVVHLSRAAARASEHDPVARALRVAGEVGLLAIDLGSRRRLRINGRIAEADERLLEITVKESFPNCLKYIQKRELALATPCRQPRPPGRGRMLDAARRAMIERADTAFVASRHPERGLDVSHRGGSPGFVRVRSDRIVRFPDYAGNGMYQTLGNFEIEPRAGVTFVDFENARQLALTGAVKTIYGAEDPTHPTGGTGRYWELVVEDWVEWDLSAAGEWRLVERSRFNPPAFAGPARPVAL